jgi:hypothetical protein
MRFSRPVSEKIFRFYVMLTTALVCTHNGIDVRDKRDAESIRVALMCAASVRRVVVTSSIRSVFGFADEHPAGYLYTEEDWNTKASLENNQGYALSKLLGEVSLYMPWLDGCTDCFQSAPLSPMVGLRLVMRWYRKLPGSWQRKVTARGTSSRSTQVRGLYSARSCIAF